MTPRLWYAAGARALLDSRKSGGMPDGPVAVACREGSFPGAAAVLFVRDDMPVDRLDWRMLVNLEVWLWADESVPADRLMALCRRIAEVRPKRLVLRFDRPYRHERKEADRVVAEHIDTHDVDVGCGYHLPAVRELSPTHEFIWLPINTCGTPVGLRLKQALVKQFGEYEHL